MALDSPTSPRTAAQQPAWSAQDLADDPHRHGDKAAKVRGMFAAIAPSYDLNNRLHSFGRDQAWRRAAVRMAQVDASTRVLDAACGTGDLAALFARAGAARVVGADFTPEMLDIARKKRSEGGRVEYVEADAMDLPFDDASFDVVSIAFGIRNVTDPARALREFHRVLTPGGRLVILEFAPPPAAPVRWANALYCKLVMPRTATLISRDRSGAYYYLPRSIETFMDRGQMTAAVRAAGFTDITRRPMTLGVCVCHRAVKHA